MVENVKSFRSELDLHPFIYVEVFEEREIIVGKAWPVEGVPRGIAEGVVIGDNGTRSVECLWGDRECIGGGVDTRGLIAGYVVVKATVSSWFVNPVWTCRSLVEARAVVAKHYVERHAGLEVDDVIELPSSKHTSH